MTFREAENTYRQLREQLAKGSLDLKEFANRANSLRVDAADGSKWQISPRDGTWLRWGADEWIAAEPPPDHVSPSPPVPVAALPPIPSRPATPPAIPHPRGAFRRFILARSERWWDLFAISGGCASGALWYGYSKLDVADTTTPFLIAGIPVVIVIFRKLIDKVLAPVHRIVGRFVPRIVRIGAGLAVPYFMAVKLYGTVSGPNYEFRYMQHVLVWSVVLSYILIRQPGGGLAKPSSAVAPPLPTYKVN